MIAFPDKILVEPTRLAIIAYLVAIGGSARHSDLLRKLRINQSALLCLHTRRLEDAGLIVADKSYVGRVHRTILKVTPLGRNALARHRAALDDIVGVLEAAE